MPRIVSVLLLLTLCVIAAGCSGSDLPPLAPVTGVVTLNDEPLPDAIVTFTPNEARPSSSLPSNESGEFTLYYKPDVPGAIVGEHRVRVELVVTEEEGNLPEGSQEAKKLPPSASDQSIKQQVTNGENHFKIEL